jgi:hypothetical protein
MNSASERSTVGWAGGAVRGDEKKREKAEKSQAVDSDWEIKNYMKYMKMDSR